MAYTSHKKHEYTVDCIQDDIPEEQVEHRLVDVHLIWPQYGDTLHEIGTEVINKLKIIPAQTIVEEHIYYTYICQTYDMEDIETPAEKTPRENQISPAVLPLRKSLPILYSQSSLWALFCTARNRRLNAKALI